MILAAHLWDEEQLEQIADVMSMVQPPQLAEDAPEYWMECACAVVEALVGPRPVEDDGHDVGWNTAADQ